MPSGNDETKIRWESGVPVSVRYDDPFFSREDGLAETRHVFLDGNGLPDRVAGARAFEIAELGFGTGLNLLATLALWRVAAAPDALLTYTAFERDPLTRAEMVRALAPWPELADLARPLLAAWPGPRIDLPGCRFTLVTGDARATVADWQGYADAWFLDGFAPARNPEMWEPSLLQAVHDRTRPGGTFATYTAAGHVRRALFAAGFDVEKVPGYGRKRDMLTGYRPRETDHGHHPHSDR